jgi:hypothetical protein
MHCRRAAPAENDLEAPIMSDIDDLKAKAAKARNMAAASGDQLTTDRLNAFSDELLEKARLIELTGPIR